MRHQKLVQFCLPFLLLSVLEGYGAALTLSEFLGYPFTGESQDDTFPPIDDTTLFFNASVQFPYFHNFYPGVSVDINGHFTFSDQRVSPQFAPRPLETVSTPRVAPFWIDLHAGIRGKVYYQVLSSTMDDDQATLASISQLSSAVLLPDISFNVKWALLVTWDHVAYYGDHSTDATFQLVVATDGIYSVTMFMYDENMKIKNSTTIGFTASNNTFYQMPHDQLVSVQSGSNAGQAGLWMFRIDGGDSLADMRSEIQFDCYQYSGVTAFLQWYKDDVMLNDTTRITGTSTNLLSISSITGSDFGVYQCYVEDFYSRAALLTVSPSGSVSTSPRALLTAASDSVSIKCFAEGGPGNSFLWRHNGTVLAKSTNSILNVTVFTTEHLGNYSCTVTNIAGHDSSTSIIHGFTAQGPGGGLCTNYTKRVMSREVEVCLPTFTTTFAFTHLRHTVIVYSTSDQSLNSEAPEQDFLLQYLYSRAQIDENANPHLLATYEESGKVPVSLTVDGLQPNTGYLIFVQVQMLHQGVVVTSYFSEGITVMTTAETATVSQTLYIITVSAMGSVTGLLVVCAVLLMTFLLCRMYFIQKRVRMVKTNQPSSRSTEETDQGACRYVDPGGTSSGGILERNPAYANIPIMGCSSHLDTTTEHRRTAQIHLDCFPEDRREGEYQNVYEDINVL